MAIGKNFSLEDKQCSIMTSMNIIIYLYTIFFFSSRVYSPQKAGLLNSKLLKK